MELGIYRKIWMERHVISIKFTQADMKNQLFRMEDNGVSVVLPMSDAFFGKKKEEYGARASKFIGRYVQVFVTGVDEATNTVTCSNREYVAQIYAENKEKLTKAIMAGEKVMSRARIVSIRGKGKNSFAIIRLLDSGLRGVVWCEDWSTDYTTDITAVAKTGEVINVLVVAVDKSSVAKADYRCSRMETLENPWSGISSKIHRGDIVNVKILEKWNKGFSGKLEGFKDISAWVALPDPEKTKMRLVPGLIYQCEVTAVDEEKKALRLRPFRLCYVD